MLYLNDPDSTVDPERIHEATILGRPSLSTGRIGWRVEIDPPLHGVRSAILADHHVGVSLDDLFSSGIGIAPSWRYVPVYVATAVAPASIDQDSFANGELSIDAWADAAVHPSDLTGPQHASVSPRERLPVALSQLERAWHASDAPIVPYLAPGRPAEDVRAALRSVGLEACDELITWFWWHDGTSGDLGMGHETWSLVSGVYLQSLEQCLESYAQAREMVEELASRGLDPSAFYPEAALPITRHLGPYMDVVSCEPTTAGYAWFVAWDDAAEPNGPHLADLVERVTTRWKLGIERWNAGAWVPRDEALLGIGPNVPW